MREVFTMWKYTKMVVLVAVSAAFYAAVAIPLKGIPLVPGITELRPAAVIPVVFGLLFGPAGAWGAAIGNLIGDFFGTLTIGSIGGFVGNFFYGLIGYKIWATMGLASSPEDLKITYSKAVNFILVAIVSSFACSVIICWWLEVVRLLPFAFIGPIIALNNLVACVILGIPLLGLLQARLIKWDMHWYAIMDEHDRPRGPSPRVGMVLIWAGVAGGFSLGVILSMNLGQSLLFKFGTGATTPSVVVGVAPFIIVFLAGCLLA